MPQGNAPINASSVLLNINILNGVMFNTLATTAIPGSSGGTVQGFASNLINSSGALNAASANAQGPFIANLATWALSFISSSASLETQQLRGASSAMMQLFQQNQEAQKIG